MHLAYNKHAVETVAVTVCQTGYLNIKLSLFLLIISTTALSDNPFWQRGPSLTQRLGHSWEWNLGAPLPFPSLWPLPATSPTPSLSGCHCPSELHLIHAYVDKAGWAYLRVIWLRVGSGVAGMTGAIIAPSEQASPCNSLATKVL